MSDNERPLRLLLIGDSGVGKSSVMIRFADNEYVPEYATTIGVDFKVKTITIDGRNIKLQLWDAGGQERFRSIAESYYRNTNGIVIVYDITNFNTFLNIGHWIESVKRRNPDSTKIIIVGNKSDQESKRVVPYEAGKKFANEHGYDFFEVSAKKGTNIEGLFHTLARSIIADSQNIPSQSRGIVLTDNRKKISGCFC
jgi:Ras-related protein Rab-1A